MTLAHHAPALALLASLTVLAVLLLREGHRDHTRPGHGHQRPHSRDVGAAQQDTDAIKENDMTEQPETGCKCGHPQERHTLLSGIYAHCRWKYTEAGRGKCFCGMYRPATATATEEPTR